MLRRRYRLLPLLYRLALEAHSDGLPIVRPLFMHFDVPKGRGAGQFLLGDGVLAQNDSERTRLWQLREQMSELQKRDGPSIKHDIAVPISAIARFVAETDALLAQMDFFEVETGREVRVFGNIAHVWSAYEARHAPGDAVPERRGINSIQLYKGEDGWKIIHMIWDNERDGVPLPAVG